MSRTHPHHEDDNINAAARERRWFHLRPRPRRRTDLLGFNSTWWMVLVWIIVIVLLIYPGPYW